MGHDCHSFASISSLRALYHTRCPNPARYNPVLVYIGENLTVSGLREAEVNIGDRFRIGMAEVVVTQPRMPCYKLGIRFAQADMVKRFLTSGRSGFYVAVEREGDIGADDAITPLYRDPRNVSVPDMIRLILGDDDPDLLHRALQIDALPLSLRTAFQDPGV